MPTDHKSDHVDTADSAHQPFPLTEIQYAYWVGRGPNFVLGNVAPHAYFELEGRRLDPALLSRAWRTLIERHGSLRTVVAKDGRQRVLPEVPRFEVRVDDLRGAAPDVRAERLAATRAEMAERVYDASVWPLFDIRMSRLDEHDRLHVSFDLLMVDLAGIAQLFTEWSALCRDEGAELPPVDVTFRDYVLALEAGRDSPRAKRSADYWAAQAETLAPPPELPLAKPPVRISKPGFTHREYHLPPQEWQRAQDLARERGLTPTAALATVFAQVLALWSGTRRFTLNLTIFNRLPLVLTQDERGRRHVHPHLRNVVGDFTSICLLEMDTEGGLTLAEATARTQTQLQHDLRHRYVSALHTLRERRRRGLQTGFDGMPVVFTSGLGTVSDTTGPMSYFGDITYRLSQTPQIWLDHQVLDVTGTLDLTWDAVEELFPEGFLDDMFAAYCAAVRRLAEPESWDVGLAIELPSRQYEVRAAANATAGLLPAGLLTDGLLRQAAEGPDRPAVIHSSGTVSFGELAARAAGIAGRVRGAIGDADPRDRLVAVTIPKGPDQIAAAHGALLAGAAYLPVGPNLPTLRRHELYLDGEALAVVTDPGRDAGLEWPEGLRRVSSEGAAGHADTPSSCPEDLAYVLFTSGSTGRPKGVMIEHGAALNTIADITERFGVGPGDRLFGLADFGFDLSVYDIFGSAAVGAALVVPDEELRGEPGHWAELMRRHGVTVWNSVPAQMQMLVEHLEADPLGEVPESLRLVMLSGDWIPLDLPERISALWPDATVISLGGATEASIWSNWHPADDVPEGSPSIPYGRPLQNQAFHVLDQDMRPCPEWVPGELYIAGAGLARGYWRDAEKTAAAFVHHPETGERLYRTGDYGRYLQNGILQFLGRRDGQVKIGGHRIETGEVEAVLTRHPGVDAAVVTKSVDDNGAASLAGFVVLDRADGSLLVETAADLDGTAERWQAMQAPATPVPGPGSTELLAAWDALNDVYVNAAAAAFRALGLAGAPGDPLDLSAARAAGVAQRYDRWLARAVDVMTVWGLLRVSERGGLEVAEPFPERIPDEVAERARRALSETLHAPEDLAAWMITLADGLADILTQSLHSAELYANDRTPEVYAHLFGQAYHVATETVRNFVAAWPEDRPLRVLEVGAGYGTLTGHLLPLLPAERTDYLFTDISTYFTDRAREVFGGHEFLRTGLFNLDQAPELQGHEDLAADLVIAASVLHDLKNVDTGLRTLRSTLAPGGVLLMVEQTAFHPWFDLTMGLQQGFDGYEDVEVRTAGHPLLDPGQWADVLADAGYAGSAVLTREGSAPAAVGFDVIAGQGPLVRSRFDREALRAHVAERLPRHMVPARLNALERFPTSATGKVDRAALAQVGGRRSVRRRAVRPPRTDRQAKLVEIYQGALGLGGVDLADDFLEAGGDSLLAARIAAALHRTFGVEVPVGVVLQQSTVAAIDAWLEPVLGPAVPLDEPVDESLDESLDVAVQGPVDEPVDDTPGGGEAA